MNRNGNTYTVLYAAIMVVLVAAILASVAMALKPQQVRNIEVEKKQSILASVNIASTPADAEKIYAEKIVNEYVVNVSGEKVEGDAFNTDLKREYAKPVEEMHLPVLNVKQNRASNMCFRCAEQVFGDLSGALLP